MATGYLTVWAGQSWLDAAFSEASAPKVPVRQHVRMMRATSRTWSNFDNTAKWNTYYNGIVAGNSPVFKFGDEWEARRNAGLLSGNLYVLSVARGGVGFDSRYSVPNFTQWRPDRKSYNGSGVENGTFGIPADQGGGVYNTGDSLSAYETLRQGVAAAKAGIELAGDTPRLLFCYWAQGHAEATVSGLTQAEYYGYEMSIKQMVESELGVSNAPWITPLIAGEPLTGRPSTGVVNAAKTQIASEFSRAWAPNPADFPEYAQGGPTFGGIFGTDGQHLSNFGCWRLADVCFGLTIDSGFTGIAI
jgi:hypothetical protein